MSLRTLDFNEELDRLVIATLPKPQQRCQWEAFDTYLGM